MAQVATEILDDKPMGAGQVLAILLCVFLIALDGFDVLAIAFAAPGISAEWDLSKSVLGWAVTMELVGMGIGSLVLGGVADKIGRRPVLLMSVTAMTIGMFCAALAPNVYVLSAFRILTGIGIGALLASVNAMVAELSNLKYRNLFILLMATGYSIGAIVGGLISAELLKVYDWRSIFYLGAGGTALALPLVYFFLPESVSYLANKRPPGALDRINKTLKRFGHEGLKELPKRAEGAGKAGFSVVFGSKFLKITILLSLAYMAHVSTFYFVVKWVPKLVVDMGFTASQGGSVLVWANMGGLAGVLVFALATQIMDLRWLVITSLIGAVIFVIMFGQISANLGMLAAVSVASGFFNNAAIAGVYPLLAKYFPSEVRAGGSGVVLGLGRAGAIGGPVIAGYLLQSDIALSNVTMLIAIGSAIAAIAVYLLGPAKSET